MPAGRPPITAHPGKPFRTLADAAREGQLIQLQCNLCRRSAYFLATDLIKAVDPRHPLHIPPFACSKCKTMEYMRMSVRLPQAGDYGRLPVRRLDRVVQVQKWRDGLLGE